MGELKRGRKGRAVSWWQQVLNKCGYSLETDGIFGTLTEGATKYWQVEHGLIDTGIVTDYERDIVFDEMPDAPSYPSIPDPPWPPLTAITNPDRELGKFRWVPAPTQMFPEGINILGNWVRDHIVTAAVPQVAKIPGYSYYGRTVGRGHPQGLVMCHKRVVLSLKELFASWERQGLFELVISFDGMFVPRTIRGSKTALSNHARGTAFDINARWNMRRKPPAPAGSYGSVIELVQTAREHGWKWGGEWDVPDPMHFQACMEALT